MARIPISVLRSSRPLIWQHEDLPEFEYHYDGTTFLAWWHGFLFALTAKHVLKDKDLSTCRVLCHDEAKLFLGFDTTYRDLDSAHDYKDLACIALLDHQLCPQILAGIAPLDPRHFVEGRSSYQPGSLLVVSGYPGERKSINYNDMTLRHQRVIAKAAYVGPDPTREHLHVLEWVDVAGVEDLRGFSGSPVFCESPSFDFGLSGLLIQASSPTSVAHFIDSAAILTALRKVAADTIRRRVDA